MATVTLWDLRLNYYTMERVFWDTYLLYAGNIIKNHDNVYYMKNKATGKVSSCFLWTGPSFIFGNKPLVSNETIVYGPIVDPFILTPQKFLSKYEFTRVGCNGMIDISLGSAQYKNMLNAKELIEKAAKISV